MRRGALSHRPAGEGAALHATAGWATRTPRRAEVSTRHTDGSKRPAAPPPSGGWQTAHRRGPTTGCNLAFLCAQVHIKCDQAA
eukprot:182877-Chlamydomonas_euryale.AAC.5